MKSTYLLSVKQLWALQRDITFLFKIMTLLLNYQTNAYAYRLLSLSTVVARSCFISIY